MFIVKVILWVVLIWLILASLFFQKILTKLWFAIDTINGDFWAYLPTDIRIFFSLLVLSLLFGLIYSFKK